MPSTNLEKIYTSPYYRSFNFQQLFFYDIFAQRIFYELSVVKVYDLNADLAKIPEIAGAEF